MFVDTSVWYAAVDRGDAGNGRAKRILAGGPPFLLTDHVLVESWLLINRRLGRAAAERFWGELMSGQASIEPVNTADLHLAWGIGQRFSDQDFSLVDRTSFAVMVRLGVQRAASFDDDFAVFRYGPRNDQAFVIVR